jgi:alpha-glucosidase
MERNGLGYIVKGARGYLHILFYGRDIVRLAYSDDRTVPDSTMAVIAGPVEINGKIEGTDLLSEAFRIEVDRESLAVCISDREGNILSEDFKVDTGEIKIEKKKQWETGIYGNGEKYSWLNQLGSETANYNSDVLLHHGFHHPQAKEMHTAIPFYIGAAPGKAYGIYFDNSYRTVFDFAKADSTKITFGADGGFLDYYFIYGRDIADIIRGYTRLTGTMPLPRRKYLGYHQSRYSYETQEELISVADNLQKHKIPCDVIYLDIAYMDAYKVFTVSTERFSEFKKVISRLKEAGFAVVVIIDPGIKVEEGYRVYDEGKEKGYFVTAAEGEIYEGEVWPKPAVFPDFLRSDVRHWWGEFHRELLASGVDGIWNDMNEPSNFTEESGTLPDQAVHRRDDGTEVLHAEAHNIYGLMQARATREALERLVPERRPFVLTRAAFAGSQRYAALWTGDISSLWEHMEISIPMILNLGLSGYAFTGADVGGFRGDCSGELLARWTQLGAFLPYFRNHSEIGTSRQEPWEFSKDILEITRSYICLRYRFITYIYNLMRESSESGAPVVRPLFYHYQDDPDLFHINDQFLLGEKVMVCPVLRPGIRQRMIYLPEGLWYDYWSGEKISGGRYITREAPLDTLPLYVRAGAVLPQDAPHPADRKGQLNLTLTMHCYTGSEGYYRLYLDDGESFKYRQGEYSELGFFLKDNPEGPEVKVDIIHEKYPIPELKFIMHGAD